jgi:hypothetical protein
MLVRRVRHKSARKSAIASLWASDLSSRQTPSPDRHREGGCVALGAYSGARERYESRPDRPDQLGLRVEAAGDHLPQLHSRTRPRTRVDATGREDPDPRVSLGGVERIRIGLVRTDPPSVCTRRDTFHPTARAHGNDNAPCSVVKLRATPLRRSIHEALPLSRDGIAMGVRVEHGRERQTCTKSMMCKELILTPLRARSTVWRDLRFRPKKTHAAVQRLLWVRTGPMSA